MCAMCVVGAFVLAGLGQSFWLAATWTERLAWPLDAGLTFRGRRLLGANKTVRGVVLMLPATVAAFICIGALVRSIRPAGVWSLSLGE
jgi:hypothetical protein